MFSSISVMEEGVFPGWQAWSVGLLRISSSGAGSFRGAFSVTEVGNIVQTVLQLRLDTKESSDEVFGYLSQ